MSDNILEARESTSVARAPRGVPRRFGLGILFVWTTLFSVALVGANALEMPWFVILVYSLFVLLVGVAQWCLGQGRRARVASVVLGVSYFWVLIPVEFVAFGGGLPLSWMSWRQIASYLVGWSIAGAVLGYFVGTFVAGVFLVAYWIDRGIARWRGRSTLADSCAEHDTPDTQELIDQPTVTG